MNIPIFPELKPITIDDQAFIRDTLWNYQPVTSELTFTNLFMWRNLYHFKWTVLNGTVLLFAGNSSDFFAMQPVGPRPFKNVILTVLHWLHDEHHQNTPHFDRVDKETSDEFKSYSSIKSEPLFSHFDYLYNTNSLITLEGRHLHSKRNHLARFTKENSYSYQDLTPDLIPQCLQLADHWCELYHCRNNPGLCAEWNAIREVLNNFGSLNCRGGVVIIDAVVEAFTLGELLNKSTAVIHIEKANTDIHGIYTAINQLFCKNAWPDSKFINREQDLGDPGLKAAKNSYHPQSMIEKFRISLI
jgi:hypothetical protein